MPFLKTTASYRQGARTLAARYYSDPAVFADERARLFARAWVCVGREADLAAPGAYLVADVGGESLIVLRDRAGVFRAFYNVCRHRGTRLCEGERGAFSETIQCRYHAWTYGLDGRLLGAPHMQEVEGFAKGDYPLHAVTVGSWEGFLFVTLATDGGSLDAFLGPLGDRFAPYHLPRLRSVRRITYDVRANWKLILQNYSECLHCPTIHPELSTKLPYTSGANDLTEGPFLGGYMEIKPPHESATMSGRTCGLLLGEVSGDDRRRAYYYTIFPTMMLSLHPDYVVYYTVRPLAPDASRVVCEWMVHPDSPTSPGYHLDDATEFWDRTNRQDWHICELSQQGVASRVYAPGP